MNMENEKWEVRPVGPHGDLAICWVGAGKGAGYVAKITHREGRDVMPKANLIAAAPDLLAALKEAINIAPLGLTPFVEWLPRAMNAINKAEGRTGGIEP